MIMVQCNHHMTPGDIVKDADAVAVTTTDDPKARQYTFRFRSRCACIGGCGGGAGCGPFCVTVLLVLTIGMGYLALGMAYNKFAKGATTIEEMLPHVAFWHAVPVRCMVCFSGAMGFIAERLFGVGYQQVSVLDDDDDDMFEDDDDNTYL